MLYVFYDFLRGLFLRHELAGVSHIRIPVVVKINRQILNDRPRQQKVQIAIIVFRAQPKIGIPDIPSADNPPPTIHN